MTFQPECRACSTVLIGAGTKLRCKRCDEQVCVHCYQGDKGCNVCNPPSETDKGDD